MRRARAFLRDLSKRPGIVEAVLRLAGVVCLVAFADYFGPRWAYLAAGLGLFVLTSERQL